MERQMHRERERERKKREGVIYTNDTLQTTAVYRLPEGRVHDTHSHLTSTHSHLPVFLKPLNLKLD